MSPSVQLSSDASGSGTFVSMTKASTSATSLAPASGMGAVTVAPCLEPMHAQKTVEAATTNKEEEKARPFRIRRGLWPSKGIAQGPTPAALRWIGRRLAAPGPADDLAWLADEVACDADDLGWLADGVAARVSPRAPSTRS